MPRIGIGIGLGRTFYAGSFADAYNARVLADGGTIEATPCVNAASTLLQSASLLLIPSGYKSGVAYSQLPNNGNGDLTWTRASTANRTNSRGLIESVSGGVPRLSYMYGSCPAVLLEPQRTNLALRSEEFDNASWLKVGGSITANTTTSPDGTTNADKLIVNNAATILSAYVQQAITKSAASITYSYTCYSKASELNAIRVYVRDSISASNFAQVYYNINDGSVITAATAGGTFSAASSTITSVANGFYRINLTFTSSTDTQLQLRIYPYDTVKTTGNGTDGIFIYGAQLEQGSFATTYIPTTSASATRVADTFSRNNIYTNGLITSSGGTWYVELKNNVSYTRDASGNGIYLSKSNTTVNDSILLRTIGANSRVSIQKYIAGASTILYTTTTDSVKLAIKWNGTTADVFVDGIKQVSSTVFIETNLDYLLTQILDTPKFIQSMALFSTPLSDSDCVSLTT